MRPWSRGYTMPADHQCLLSRRRLFLLAGAGIAARLPLGAATPPDFWNKKAPADWTNEEIDRLIAKSPWAKPVKASYAPGEAPYDTDLIIRESCGFKLKRSGAAE